MAVGVSACSTTISFVEPKTPEQMAAEAEKKESRAETFRQIGGILNVLMNGNGSDEAAEAPTEEPDEGLLPDQIRPAEPDPAVG